jgi:hypothetical protein
MAKEIKNITKEVAENFLKEPNSWDLSKRTHLDEDAAEVLGRFKGSELLLQGLEALTEAAAKSLAQFNGGLDLRGLKSIHWKVATHLSRAKRQSPISYVGKITQYLELILDGLTEIDIKSAKAFSKNKGYLDLDGIKEFSDDVLNELCNRTGGRLSLGGLSQITERQAEALACHCGTLVLGGVSELTDEAAKNLSYPRDGRHGSFAVFLPYLIQLSPKAIGYFIAGGTLTRGGNDNKKATELLNKLNKGEDILVIKSAIEHYKYITDPEENFQCLDTSPFNYLSKNAIEALINSGLNFNVDGLLKLSCETATVLATAKCSLDFYGLTEISDDVAIALSDHKKNLTLNKLTEISDVAAQALANYQGDCLDLRGLKKLSQTAARSLLSLEDRVWLGELPELDDETLCSISSKATHTGLFLNQQSELSLPAATSLSKFAADLYLNGVKTMSEDVAEALSPFEGKTLKLNGLESLSPEVAAHLTKNKSHMQLSLNGLVDLSEEAAEVLGASKSGNISLMGLKTLSDAAADSLSQWLGYPYMGKISLHDEIVTSKKARATLKKSKRIYLNYEVPGKPGHWETR